MSQKTSIEWCTHTWNPTSGCSVISPGCKRCYAMGIAHRFRDVPDSPLNGLTHENGVWNGLVRVNSIEKIDEPLHWREPRRVFVNSMSDLFHDAIQDEELDLIFAVMAAARRHRFLILTKRAERMRRYMTEGARRTTIARLNDKRHSEYRYAYREVREAAWPLPNVWLGVSIEDQFQAMVRGFDLVNTPAAVRFVSCEPLLERVRLSRVQDDEVGAYHNLLEAGIHWVIGGGESGKGARPCQVEDLIALREECRENGVAYFNKQLGSNARKGKARVLAGSKGGDIEQWPLDLRVREFPEVRA